MNIRAPEEFKKACQNLGQGLEISSGQQMAEIALIGIDQRERRVIKAFLDDLLKNEHSLDELKEFWWSMPADIVFHEGEGIVAFLTLLRDEIARGP